jgi:hypothetical protein
MAGGPLNFLENTELGVSVLETIASRQALEIVLAGFFGAPVAAAIIGGNLNALQKVPKEVLDLVLPVIENAEQAIGQPVFQSFIQASLGINLSDTTGQEAQAVRMIERAIGFGFGVPAIVGPLAGILETKLGHHAPKELFKAIKDIPHDIGMSFFLGTTLASIFETATNGPIGEAIREQTRPARLEWPQLARLLKAKLIDPALAEDYLRKAGFRDQDIPILEKLDAQLLSVSHLQTLHEIGWYDDGVTRDYLDRLGFEPADRDAVMQIFGHAAATEGATSFRTVARNAFLLDYISESTYRELLKSAETPPESIDLLVAGVQLERDAGRLHLTVADIKDLWQHQHINSDEARQKLAILGMADRDIADLLIVWQDGLKVARSGISSAKVIQYLLGGVIDKQAALNRLIQNGMNAKDAQFLVDHPSTHPQVAKKPITAATVVAAYKDDVLSIDEARALLLKIPVDPTQVELLLANANFTVTKGKKPKKPTKTLTETHVVDALKYGLATDTWAERELETLGYAAADASLLVMTELAKLDPANVDKHGWQVLT